VILLIDNYDSFVFNLKRYLVRLGQAVRILRNDDPLLRQFLTNDTLDPDVHGVILSPGPKRPEDAGLCVPLVQKFSGRLPILGVCLGHQVIYHAFGGVVHRAARPMHGRSSLVDLGSSRLFAGLGAQEEFARYHSLVADANSLPACLRIIATCDDPMPIQAGEPQSHRVVMAIEHQIHPTFGVQFHPESVLSTAGYRLLANFLHIAQLPIPDQLPTNDLVESDNWQAWKRIRIVDEPFAIPLPKPRSEFNE
jgi:anthranilate synthase/aminodeoxychorismate synthase-like glutamine amidotransferase